MKRLTPSPVIALAVIGTQLLGPAVLWAADQRGVRIEATRRVVVSALSGDQLSLQNSGGTKTLQFRESVAAGDRLTTGDRTMAEVLFGTRAVVTVGQGTSVQFTTVTPEQTTIQVSKGTVRVAAAASALGEQGLVTVQTPTGQVQTRGGIVRVLVDAPVRAAEQTPTGEARPYLASYSPTTLLAAVNTRGDVIQVEEGTAEILGAGPGAKAVTVQAGQAVGVQAGQAGPIVGITTQDTLRPGVVATAGHRSTPKEGMDNLVALQVDQATQLGKALTGAAETGEGESGKKDESGKALNGATGGVALANAVANALFGSGSTANATSGGVANVTGAGYGGNNNNGFNRVTSADVGFQANGSKTSLLIFTRKDPVDPTLNGISCGLTNCSEAGNLFLRKDLTFTRMESVKSQFTVAKELVLIGGSSNNAHGGVAPTETLIVRGAAAPTSTSFTNLAYSPGIVNGLYPSDRAPAFFSISSSDTGVPKEVLVANSTFVVKTPSEILKNQFGGPEAYVGGTLGQFSKLPDLVLIPNSSPQSFGGIAIDQLGGGVSHVDGAITATSSNAVPVVTLKGGVTLDQGTKATIGTTDATNNYYTADATRKSTLQNLGATFTGSLLSVINGPNNGVTTSVTVQDRLLGVYDGSTINFDPAPAAGNKALLSVLDAKLKGPGGDIPLIDIAKGEHFPGTNEDPNRDPRPNVQVTSAVVVRSTIPLDGALLEASAPLLALTNATMTTASHFADLAGNKNQSMVLGDALVALNASQLLIQKGNLLNLNAATATVNGYLFSLAGGSTLTIREGALFSLNNGSSLNLTGINGNAFGVFGSGTNTLSFTNTLCPAGACGQLQDSAGQAFRLNLLGGGTSPILVAGTNKNVVLPAGFNVFAGASGATPSVTMGNQTTALFHVDETSTLIIKGTSVIKR